MSLILVYIAVSFGASMGLMAGALLNTLLTDRHRSPGYLLLGGAVGIAMATAFLL